MDVSIIILISSLIGILYAISIFFLIPEIIDISQNWSVIPLVALCIIFSPIVFLAKCWSMSKRDDTFYYEFTKCCESPSERLLVTEVIPNEEAVVDLDLYRLPPPSYSSALKINTID